MRQQKFETALRAIVEHAAAQIAAGEAHLAGLNPQQSKEGVIAVIEVAEMMTNTVQKLHELATEALARD